MPPEQQPTRNDTLAESRAVMLREHLIPRGIRDPQVLAAMSSVPREAFVPDDLRSLAYADQPLPLDGAPISQPYVVAYMTEVAAVRPEMKVLEIGTGSGYQAAVLAELGAEVYSVEIQRHLAVAARERLRALGYANVRVRVGDGREGWPEAAPFDAIVVTAAPVEVPQPLLDQLADGGRLVAPVGPAGDQAIVVFTRTGDAITERRLGPVAFVPLVSGGS